MIYILLSLIILGCSKEEQIESTNYFLGEWNLIVEYYRCCDTCFENYENDCEQVRESTSGECVFREDGSMTIFFDHGFIRDSYWCFNANTRDLKLKEYSGAVTNFKTSFIVQPINDDSFLAKGQLGLVSLEVMKLNRK